MIGPVSLSALRQSISATIGGIEGMRLAPIIPSQIGRQQNYTWDGGYTVDLRQSTAIQSRQRPAEGMMVETSMRLRWLSVLSQSDVLASYDRATDRGDLICAALRGSAASPLMIQSISYDADGSGGWIVGTVDSIIYHQLPLGG